MDRFCNLGRVFARHAARPSRAGARCARTCCAVRPDKRQAKPAREARSRAPAATKPPSSTSPFACMLIAPPFGIARTTAARATRADRSRARPRASRRVAIATISSSPPSSSLSLDFSILHIASARSRVFPLPCLGVTAIPTRLSCAGSPGFVKRRPRRPKCRQRGSSACEPRVSRERACGPSATRARRTPNPFSLRGTAQNALCVPVQCGSKLDQANEL